MIERCVPGLFEIKNISIFREKMVVFTAARACIRSNRNFLLQGNFYLCSDILHILQCLKPLRQASG